MPNGNNTNSQIFSAVSDILSFTNPALGVVSCLASTVLSELNSSNDNDLQHLVGLDKIASTLEDIAAGKTSIDALLPIASELRQINIAMQKFTKLIS
ncbi:MAG: hypothetical protein RL154_1166 [Pseudomonadota bacterium]|jgi:hypothetical protein